MGGLCRKCLLRDAFPQDYHKYVEALLIRVPAAQKAREEIYQSRLEACKACDQLSNGTCMGCGCLVELRAAYAREKCPFHHW